ncbi:tripartite motif-containing protein 16-like [Sardina pilchardus]|uniref:tripartite motif-containing protein 16-like n=1 Tax=Sardina pilchardus TaxID=27697 RepID=UPI002E11AB34
MVEKMREEGAEGASLPHYAEPGDEECSVCIGRKRKATMVCLECLDSYCESHFRSHEELFLTKKHKTVNATAQGLREKICGRHKKLLDVGYFAVLTSSVSVMIYECALDEHRGHDTISASMERVEKQRQTNLEIAQLIQEKENKIQETTTAMNSLMLSSQTLVEQNRSDFAEFINSIMEWCSKVEQCIRSQEKAHLSYARGQLSNLEQGIAGLRRRKAELEQLSQTEGDVQFLKVTTS